MSKDMDAAYLAVAQVTAQVAMASWPLFLLTGTTNPQDGQALMWSAGPVTLRLCARILSFMADAIETQVRVEAGDPGLPDDLDWEGLRELAHQARTVAAEIWTKLGVEVPEGSVQVINDGSE